MDGSLEMQFPRWIFLTHSCLDISLTTVVWTLDTYENNFGINHKFAKHFKESCGLDFH